MVEKKSLFSTLFDIFLTLFMIIVVIIFVYPFIYILLYSVSDVAKMKFPLLIYPVGFNLEPYKAIFRDDTYTMAVFVTIARCVVGPLLMLVVSGSGAYALSRPNLIFGKCIRIYLLFSMYISAGIIPSYMLMKYLGLINNFLVYVLPGMASIFNMLLIKAYISSLPRELEESVFIDGGNDIDAYFRIILPLTLPINAAVILFAVIGQWNSYMDVTMYNGNRPQLYTLAFKLWLNFRKSTNLSLEEMQAMREQGITVRLNAKSLNMAMTVIMTLPIMCLYPMLQKYFASGLLIGSIKM